LVDARRDSCRLFAQFLNQSSNKLGEDFENCKLIFRHGFDLINNETVMFTIISITAIPLLVLEIHELIFIIIVSVVIVRRWWYLTLLSARCLDVVMVIWIPIVRKPLPIDLFLIHFPDLLLKLIISVVSHELILIYDILLIILNQIRIEEWPILVVQITQILTSQMWWWHLIELVVHSKTTQMIMKHSRIVTVVQVHLSSNLWIGEA